VGIGATIAVSATTGGAVLPLTLSLCETDAGGNCKGAPAASVTLPIGAGGTATFGVFATAAGVIPLDAANNRIFVLFTDLSNVVRGADERGGDDAVRRRNGPGIPRRLGRVRGGMRFPRRP